MECEVVELEAGSTKAPVVHIVLNPEYIGKDEEVIMRVHKLCKENLTTNEMPTAYKIREAFGTNQISGKCDTLSLKDERDGYFAIDGDTLRDVGF